MGQEYDNFQGEDYCEEEEADYAGQASICRSAEVSVTVPKTAEVQRARGKPSRPKKKLRIEYDGEPGYLLDETWGLCVGGAAIYETMLDGIRKDKVLARAANL